MSTSNYLFINSPSNDGAVNISSNVFKDIIESSIKKFKNIHLYLPKKKSSVKEDSIFCTIKDNKVYLGVNISVKKGIDIQKNCLKIKEDIISSCQQMCEINPSEVIINIANIDF